MVAGTRYAGNRALVPLSLGWRRGFGTAFGGCFQTMHFAVDDIRPGVRLTSCTAAVTALQWRLGQSLQPPGQMDRRMEVEVPKQEYRRL
jgi:hypothetical protein